MAEEEDIIILEDDDEEREDKEGEESDLEDETKEEKKPKSSFNKLYLIIGILSLTVAVVIITLLVLAYLKKQEKKSTPPNNTSQIIKRIENRSNTPSITPSRLEEMIKKANYLYTKGDKQEALKIYKNISLYNESISNYNIGVALMKEKKYKEAIDSFQKAIQNGENRCVSSINSAVCALLSNDKISFEKYLKDAKNYLPYEVNEPLYSYYVSLINFYEQNYIESLVPLFHPTSKFYKDEQNYLISKTEEFLENDIAAIDALEKIKNYNTDFPLGLLYAKIREYDIAVKKLQNAIDNGQNIPKAKTALALIYNKTGNLKKSADLIKELYQKYNEKLNNIYPISVRLKDSLFDITLAQKEFKENIFLNDEKAVSLLFYYTPYKVFNANQTVSYIKKGSVTLFIDEIKPAVNYLKTSSTISKVNLALSNGIKYALNHDIYKANEIFKRFLKKYPKHSVLHFDLALTYAKIGDFVNAHKHFLRSYHLDNNNFLSGLYAAILEKLLRKDNTMLINIIKEDIEESKDITDKDKHFFFTLSSIAANLSSGIIDYLDMKNLKKPLKIALGIIISHKLKRYDRYKDFTTKLHKIMPKDLIANILYLDAKNRDKEIKSYAKAIQDELITKKFDLSTFYNGYLVSRILYTKIIQIGGLLNQTRETLKKESMKVSQNPVGILQSLAYLDIYTNNFEESYILYNELIDTYKQQDGKTLFFASVASIGANHHANAIALLELAKLTDPANFESRYALGLLYHEIKNFEAAAIQYDKIGDSGFVSEYFSFDIKKGE